MNDPELSQDQEVEEVNNDEIEDKIEDEETTIQQVPALNGENGASDDVDTTMDSIVSRHEDEGIVHRREQFEASDAHTIQDDEFEFTQREMYADY